MANWVRILNREKTSVALVALTAACAGTQSRPGAPPVTPPPQTTTTATALQPPPSAVRVSERAALTGIELGTMWTFENPPLAYWQKQYSFTPSREWLEHVRLSSVRYGEYCSASFVSPNGLVMTNHHCARECVEANSRAGTDYVVTGFYAAKRSDEKLCPGLFLDQLVDIADVTQNIRAATRGVSASEAAQAQANAIERTQKECEAQSRLTCQVVTLYHGGQYQLYKYRRYAPVKLVFAPELQAGFFGGDPDNFTYPRYDLDVSFVRAYEQDGDTATSTPHFFQWKAQGGREGDLVFVTGNPGSTSRQITVAQVMYERQYKHPLIIGLLRAQRELLNTLAKRGPEAEQEVRENLFEIENSLKAYEGQYGGLQDSLLLGQKIRWEKEFQTRVNADPSLRSQFGDVWDRLADIQLQKLHISPRLNVANAAQLGAPTLLYPYNLVRYVQARAVAEDQRPEDLRGARWVELEQMLQSGRQPDPVVNELLLRAHLQMAVRWLPESDPLRTRLILPGESVEAAARRLAQNTRIFDPAYRQQLISGGNATLATVQDSLVQAAVLMVQVYNESKQKWDQLGAEEAAQQERLAQALFAVFGTNLPPDATFTLRLSDGVIKGYPYNGTMAPSFTTFYGIFGRAAEFANEMPFTLPKTYGQRRAAIDMATPLDFVTTNDITGGNSGSPVIDRDARIVGLAFDGNIESLPNEFLYRNETGRAVAVHTAGITEALRNIYRAEALLRELMGGSK